MYWRLTWYGRQMMTIGSVFMVILCLFRGNIAARVDAIGHCEPRTDGGLWIHCDHRPSTYGGHVHKRSSGLHIDLLPGEGTLSSIPNPPPSDQTWRLKVPKRRTCENPPGLYRSGHADGHEPKPLPRPYVAPLQFRSIPLIPGNIQRSHLKKI